MDSFDLTTKVNSEFVYRNNTGCENCECRTSNKSVSFFFIEVIVVPCLLFISAVALITIYKRQRRKRTFRPPIAGNLKVACSTHYRSCVRQAELWCNDSISSGDYSQKSLSLYCFRAGIFDEHGGKLQFDETGLALLIPPGAIKYLKPQLIYIYLYHENNLTIAANTIRTSPIVYCGPPGLKFKERVILSYQHCANNDDSVKLVTLRTETEPDQCPNFYNLSDDNNSMNIVKDNIVSLLLPHFTGHTTVVEQGSVSIEKWLDLMLFSSQIRENDYDVQLRLYCVNKTQDARYLALEDERMQQNGSMCFTSTPFLFSTDYDVNVFLNSEGNWAVRGEKNKQVLAKKCLVENDCTPCVYNLEYDQAKTVANLRCQVHVYQDEKNENKKIMDVLVKKEQETQVVQEPCSPVRRCLLLSYPLRECIRKKLDIPNTLGNDWKNLAYYLGYDGFIAQWEENLRNEVISSPTTELLNLWEARGSENGIAELVDILKNKMQRLDIVSEIDKWYLVKPGRTDSQSGH